MSRNRRSKSSTTKAPNKSLAAKPTAAAPLINGAAAVTATKFTATQFSGPLPHPDILIKYNDVVPNGAERIMRMAEKQQDHRMFLEKHVIEGDTKRANLGLVLGFILALFVLAGGVWVVLMGKDIVGFSMIIIPLASLIGSFIYSQNTRKKEREARNKTITEKRMSNKS